MLTCFELTTGSARWRLNSVGISAVQADDQGRLTSIPPAQIRTRSSIHNNSTSTTRNTASL